VEADSTEEVFTHPAAAYTQALLAAIPDRGAFFDPEVLT